MATKIIAGLSIVVYGWGGDVAGFLVEKISGQTLEQFLYVEYLGRSYMSADRLT